MHVQPIFEVTEPDRLWRLIADHRLGCVITAGPDGVEANHLPFELDQAAGVLRCHAARTNPIWRSIAAPGETLVVFQGPEHYVSPNWQPGLQRHGKVAPSWHYAVVHAYGRVGVDEDEAWLRRHLDGMAAQNERDQATPWTLAAAPPEYVAGLVQHIVGLELTIDRLIGKWQTGQQYNAATRAGVIAGLTAKGDERAAAVVNEVRAMNPDPAVD